MQSLKKIFEFYIFSNIHVALAGFCLTKITLLKFANSTNLVPYFVGLSIVVSYNFIRFYEIKTNSLIWLKVWFIEHTKSLFILSIFSGIGVAYISLFTDFNSSSFLVLFPFAFMTFFYVIPLFKIGNIEVSFRNFPAIKILSIAISWAGISVFFPLFEVGYSFTNVVYLEFFQRILFVMAITIPFDIRDVTTDSKALKTLPQLIGIKKSKYLGIGLLSIFIGIDFFKLAISQSELIVTIGIAIISALFLLFSKSCSRSGVNVRTLSVPPLSSSG